METLKKIFPFSFTAKKDLVALIINILIYIALDVVIGFVIGLLANIPLIGIIFGLVGGLVGLYFFVGAILSVLDYLKVLK